MMSLWYLNIYSYILVLIITPKNDHIAHGILKNDQK